MLDTDPATANMRPDEDYVIGDQCADTAILPLPEVAKRLERDILDVQGDDLIADDAVFDVTTDESGPQGVVYVAVSGLATPAPTGTGSDVVRDTITSVVELASHYNWVERLRPDRYRFLLEIDVVSKSGTVVGGFIGTMRFHDR